MKTIMSELESLEAVIEATERDGVITITTDGDVEDIINSTFEEDVRRITGAYPTPDDQGINDWLIRLKNKEEK